MSKHDFIIETIGVEIANLCHTYLGDASISLAFNDANHDDVRAIEIRWWDDNGVLEAMERFTIYDNVHNLHGDKDYNPSSKPPRGVCQLQVAEYPIGVDIEERGRIMVNSSGDETEKTICEIIDTSMGVRTWQ